MRTHTEERGSCEDKGKDWSDAATSQGSQWTVGTITASRGKRGPPCRLQREKSLAYTLASDFEPSAL